MFLPEPPAAVHVIVQFEDPPSADTLLTLAQRGATTVAFIPDNAVLVTMDATVSLAGLGVRYAAPLSPYQKISPLIAKGDPAVIQGYYLVEFHPDIDPSDARRLILNLPLLELLDNPDLASRHLLVHIPDPTREAEALASLAAQDAVAYIFPASRELIQGQPVATDFPVAPGFLVASGEVLGQLVSTFGDGWDGPGRNAATLYYVFSQLTAQLPDLLTQSEILRALEEWAKVAQITWLPGVSATANRTVDILFATGDHGDGFPFDGPGGVLAHTFYPSLPAAEPLAGDMHFDDAESWHVGSNYDVFSVAMHEAGHALGLGSSDNPDSVMYPYYRLRTGLSDDDKAAILSLYAAQTGTVPPSPLALTVNAPPPRHHGRVDFTLRNRNGRQRRGGSDVAFEHGRIRHGFGQWRELDCREYSAGHRAQQYHGDGGGCVRKRLQHGERDPPDRRSLAPHPDGERSSRDDHVRDGVALGNRNRRQRHTRSDVAFEHRRVRHGCGERHELGRLEHSSGGRIQQHHRDGHRRDRNRLPHRERDPDRRSAARGDGYHRTHADDHLPVDHVVFDNARLADVHRARRRTGPESPA